MAQSYSFSKDYVFEQCGRRGALEVLNPSTGFSNARLQFGVAQHDFMEGLFKYLGNLDRAQAVALMSEQIPAFASRCQDPWARASVKQTSAEVLKDDRILSLAGGIPELALAFDSDWNQVHWFADEARFRLRIDLWLQSEPDDGTVIDWKTSATMDNVDEFQLELYCAVLFHINPGLQHIKAMFWFVALGEFLEYHYWRDQLGWVLPEMTSRMEAFDKLVQSPDKARPSVGAACAECAFISSCPAFIDAIKHAEDSDNLVPPVDDLEALRMKDRSVILAKASVRMKSLFDSYVDGRGEVLVSHEPGKSYRRIPKVNRIPMSKTIFDSLLSIGVPTEELIRNMTFSVSSAEELLSKYRQDPDQFFDKQPSSQIKKGKVSQWTI